MNIFLSVSATKKQIVAHNWNFEVANIRFHRTKWTNKSKWNEHIKNEINKIENKCKL